MPPMFQSQSQSVEKNTSLRVLASCTAWSVITLLVVFLFLGISRHIDRTDCEAAGGKIKSTGYGQPMCLDATNKIVGY